MIRCQKCGTEHQDGKKFCRTCGEELKPDPAATSGSATSTAQRCPQCGANVEPGKKFCRHCGSSLHTDPAPPAIDNTPAHKSSVWIWIVAVLLLVAVVIGAYLLRDHSLQPKPPKTTPAPTATQKSRQPAPPSQANSALIGRWTERVSVPSIAPDYIFEYYLDFATNGSFTWLPGDSGEVTGTYRFDAKANKLMLQVLAPEHERFTHNFNVTLNTQTGRLVLNSDRGGRRWNLIKQDRATAIPDKSSATAPSKPKPKPTGTTVASGNNDMDGDGKSDKVSVVLIKGRRYNDTELWAGAGKKYEGTFILRIEFGDNTLAETNLNSIFSEDPLFFWDKPWSIQFNDYNRDGKPDFNLGVYAGSNGSLYKLFTLDSVRSVSEMRFSDRDGLFITDQSNSTTKIPVGPGGIVFERYDNTVGRMVKQVFRWDQAGGQFNPVK